MPPQLSILIFSYREVTFPNQNIIVYFARICTNFADFDYFYEAMKEILKIDDPNVYARFVGAPVLHRQIAVISYDEVSPFRSSLNNYGVYGLFIQQQFPKYLSYGTKAIVVGDRSIIAIAPGQIGGAEDNGTPLYINGWALLWSPELLKAEYPFFSYFATDALRMEPQEWERISTLISIMRTELRENTDSPALNSIIVNYLQLILSYCNRIYQRQLSEDHYGESDILKRFHHLLVDYFTKGLQHEMGIPTVSWCASELAYSAHYFGDIIHQETGRTAIGYIHDFVVGEAKNLLMKGLGVSEVAYLLGFSYPNHFSRLFKKISGLSPTEFALGSGVRSGS